MNRVTLGGQRLGSGKKMDVSLPGYGRSNHNLGNIVRTTMSAGTLVPFQKWVGLPGDTWDFEFDVDVKTHPTVGPLFGSYKVQLDVFMAPFRLYQAQLHNNKLNIGNDMSVVKLPQITLEALPTPDDTTEDVDNAQINPSSIMAYGGIRGVGWVTEAQGAQDRNFQITWWLMYWDTYKNYYANKQEGIGAVIHTALPLITDDVTGVEINGTSLSEAPTITDPPLLLDIINGEIKISYTGTPPADGDILINTTAGETVAISAIANLISDVAGVQTWQYYSLKVRAVRAWRMRFPTEIPQLVPKVTTFDLSQIDDMREWLLSQITNPAPVIINDALLEPYSFVLNTVGQQNQKNLLVSQEGLAIKTYQSDLFNNWLDTAKITEINTRTRVSTEGGFFLMDALLMSKKIYDLLNAVEVAGGSYDDWMMAAYDHKAYARPEIPMYMGGLIKELVFQEVVSNSATDSEGGQPLGTLAGKGVMAKKHKGGRVTIKVDEHCYIMAIISLTPRVDYSQGNDWDTHLETMDDFHKPALDEIGFQDLIQEQKAWWSTDYAGGGEWQQHSSGMQPAWLNYMTNVNKVYGNFAIKDNEMFMTLNRRYDKTDGSNTMLDDTTYIDPSKYNFIFAETALDAQNFWVQIATDATARRKMSEKIMPQL